MRMNFRKTRSTKTLKVLGLLISSMLIASVSAAVYYSLNMTSTIATATRSVYFVNGPDNASAGVSISSDGMTAQLTTLKAFPNATTTYDDPIRVRNNHTSASFNIRLRHVSLSGAATNFVFVNFTLVGTTDRELDYTSDQTSWTLPSSTSWIQIASGTEYAIRVETRAIPNAAADSVGIEIEVDVE